MGSGRNYNPLGGFEVYNWVWKGELYHGLKVIYNKNDEKNNTLPLYSNTSDAYIRKVDGEVVQVRFYKDRKAFMDIDLLDNNEHKNPDGTKLSSDMIHIHNWGYEDGKWRRLEEAHYMTDSEIAAFKELIESFGSKKRMR